MAKQNFSQSADLGENTNFKISIFDDGEVRFAFETNHNSGHQASINVWNVTSEDLRNLAAVLIEAAGSGELED